MKNFSWDLIRRKGQPVHSSQVWGERSHFALSEFLGLFELHLKTMPPGKLPRVCPDFLVVIIIKLRRLFKESIYFTR